jgi:methyltransferase
MTSEVAFTLLVAAVAVQRLVELGISRRNRRALLARGGVPVGDGHYPVMVVLHASFLVSAVAEVWLVPRPWRPWLAVSMLALLAAAMVLRVWTIRTLGQRWTTRIIVLPGAPIVTGGPYRWLRHPNYLVVVVELVALPMVHGAWWTAAGFSVANAALLAVRIRTEELALARLAGRAR